MRWRFAVGKYAYEKMPANCLAQHLKIPLVKPQDLDLPEPILVQLLQSDNGCQLLRYLFLINNRLFFTTPAMLKPVMSRTLCMKWHISS